MSLLLRKAAARDEPAIFGLIRQGGINPTGVHWNRFVVIDSPEGRVIACGQLKPHKDGSWELASIVVEKEWRGQGLARRIIDHLLALHSGPLYLLCESGLQPLYEKFGFTSAAEDELPRYFRRVRRFMRIPERLKLFSIAIMKRDPE